MRPSVINYILLVQLRMFIQRSVLVFNVVLHNLVYVFIILRSFFHQLILEYLVLLGWALHYLKFLFRQFHICRYFSGKRLRVNNRICPTWERSEPQRLGNIFDFFFRSIYWPIRGKRSRPKLVLIEDLMSLVIFVRQFHSAQNTWRLFNRKGPELRHFLCFRNYPLDCSIWSKRRRLVFEWACPYFFDRLRFIRVQSYGFRKPTFSPW